MDRADGRSTERAPAGANPGDGSPRPELQPAALVCNRCGFPVATRAMGCKNPCANCGTVYPIGDCSD